MGNKKKFCCHRFSLKKEIQHQFMILIAVHVYCDNIIWLVTCRVPAGQGKLEKNHGICVVRERSGKNIILEKSGKMMLDHAHCRFQWFFVSKFLKAGEFVASIKRLKARSVSASGGQQRCPPSLTIRQALLSFVYCFINSVSLTYDIVYHIWYFVQ